MPLKIVKLLLLVLIIEFSFSVQSIAEAVQLDSPQAKEDYNQLINELHCKVCQNQSLAKANTQLAIDLRKQVLQQVKKGLSRNEIATYMVGRYGDFVTYHPRDDRPMLYRLGIIIFFIIIAGVIVFYLQKRNMRKLMEINYWFSLIKASILAGVILTLFYTVTVVIISEESIMGAEGLSNILGNSFGMFFISAIAGFSINAILYLLRKGNNADKT